MTELASGRVRDAAEAGLGLAFPLGLRERMSSLAARWAPLDHAVAAGWAGLDRLRMETLAANGVAPVRDRAARGLAGEVPGLAGDEEVSAGAPGLVAGESRAGGGWLAAWIAGAVAPMRRVWQGREPGAERGLSGPAVVDEARSERVWAAELIAAAVDAAAAPDGQRAAGLSLQDVGAAAPVIDGERAATGSSVVVRTGGAASGGSSSVQRPLTMVAAAPVRRAGLSLTADVGAALRERPGGSDGGPVTAGGGGLLGEAVAGSGRSAALSSGAGRSAADAGWRGGSGGGLDGAAGGGGLEGGFAPAAGGSAGGAGQGPSGSVMLDGRLVGHWLSEGMARDAARPGAGTTGFDARQAPAWTPSGVF